LQPVELRFPPAFARFVYYRPCLRERITPLLLLPHFPIHLGQQGKTRRPVQLCPRGTKGGYAVAHQCEALLLLSLLSQCPALPDVCGSHPELPEPVLRAERYCRLCPLLDQLHLPAEYPDHGRKGESDNHTGRMSQVPSERQSLVHPLPCLVGIAQQP